jgi:thioredoxin 1
MIQNLTRENFNNTVLNAEPLVLIDYWSPTCGPCEMYHQVLTGLEPLVKNQVKIYNLNVDEEIAIANQEGILIMPTTKIYYQGTCIKEILGVQSQSELLTILENLKEYKK